ncbi:hypothetical protein PIB30_114845, partial [Stylosanthes scabra]|nr:hypothetical protein [Stylosanthes scabra]
FPEPSRVPKHLLLLPHANTTETYTSFRKELRKVPFLCLHDNYCCKRTLSEVDNLPNFPSDPTHKIAACLLKSELSAPIVHLSEDDMLYSYVSQYQTTSEGLPKTLK